MGEGQIRNQTNNGWHTFLLLKSHQIPAFTFKAQFQNQLECQGFVRYKGESNSEHGQRVFFFSLALVKFQPTLIKCIMGLGFQAGSCISKFSHRQVFFYYSPWAYYSWVTASHNASPVIVSHYGVALYSQKQTGCRKCYKQKHQFLSYCFYCCAKQA